MPARPRGLTREQIVDTAVALADREGLDAVSIRRIAAELGARPMSLYAHFETKEDLLELMHDSVVQEALLDDEEIPAEWQEALRMIARHTRAATLEHPWLVAAFGRRTHLGPAALRHIDQSHAAVRGLDADDETRQALIVAVDTYTLGHVIAELAGELGGGSAEPARREAIADYVQTRVDAGELPHLAQSGFDGLMRVSDPEASFEQGLSWLLAGAAASLR